ncbi:MAG: adenylate/guanylate cyclase domain-containing protein [Terricaulis sp.]|nr:adenylate/guanylate cyclase domain-containing protein [Terricaulis sp.]
MQRKLTVILSADVVGYSALMERDEAGTLARLGENRAALFDPRVAAQGGRIFKVMGDGVLIEFPSAAAAVACALDIQEAMKAAEAARPEAERLRYRIGVNLGDVIIQGDDIYGDGVNVAARLQALAPVGGVALSRSVREQVAGKVAAEFDDLGDHTVKNIERPVHVFIARPEGGGDMLGVEPPQTITICVLPFANMSGDSEQEYFSDGISEDIITDLSKISALDVIARNSAFAYKGKNVSIPQVARQLNVTHVLEGSVRKSGRRVRITAQLIDGVRNNHLWAERYDRDLDDIFAVQDEISQAIVSALKLTLMPQEKKPVVKMRGTDSAEAYNLLLMARQEWYGGESDPRRNNAIVRFCQRAVQIDPNYARAWAMMGMAQSGSRYSFGGEGDGGRAAAERALALDPQLAEAHAIMARVLDDDGRADEALAEVEIALALDPESHEVNRCAARMYFARGRITDAERHFQKASSLVEADIASTSMLTTCRGALGDAAGVREAAEIVLQRAEKVLAQDRNNSDVMGYGADALAALGEIDRAKDWMDRALLIDPDNLLMRYNFACCLALHLKDAEAALDMLGPVLAQAAAGQLHHTKIDPDLALIHAHPRFAAMVAEAEARLGEV